MDLPQRFIHGASRYLGEPVVDARKERKNRPRGDDIMKVADHIVRVMQMNVGPGQTQGKAGQPADGEQAEFELFEWWSQMIELPVVAEGGLDADLVAKLAPVTDFFGVGDEIWSDDDPANALRSLLAPLG